MQAAALQLSLFPEIVESAYLVAVDNPRDTFYRIWIEENAGAYSVVKESGSKGRVLDKRVWPMDGYEQAKRLFDCKVKAKTNSERKSLRKYRKCSIPTGRRRDF